MPELNLLTVNPVTAGIESAQRMEAQRQRGRLLDMQVEDVRAKRAQEQAATEALNRIYADGGAGQGTEQVYRRLAADPTVSGSRRLESLKSAEDSALRRMQVEAQARERDARLFKTFLENGMDASANEVAKRMGYAIPPDFWADKAKRRALIERLEIEDKQAGIGQKRAAAGASSASADASRALAEERRGGGVREYTDHENRVVRERDGRSTFVTGPDGQPIRTAPRGGAEGGRPSVYRERYDAWLKRHPGDEDGALRYAASERDATVADKVKIARDMADKASEGIPSRFEPAYRKALESFGLDPDDPFGARSRQQARPQQPAAPSAMNDAEDVPRNADRKVDPNRLVDGKKYRIPLRSGGQTIGQWNAKTGRFDEVQ